MRGPAIPIAVAVTLAAGPVTAQPAAPAPAPAPTVAPAPAPTATLTPDPDAVKAKAEAEAEAKAEAEDQFKQLTASTLATIASLRAAVEGERLNEVSVRAPSLSTANASTASDLAQAAISTDVKGAQAGVTVSPLVLFGNTPARVQPAVTFAALDDGVTRFQAGLSWQPRLHSRSEISSCRPTPDELVAWKSDLDNARPAYVQACLAIRRLAARADLTANQRSYLDAARAQCEPVPGHRTMKRLGTARDTMVRALKKLNSETAPEGVRAAFNAENLPSLVDDLNQYKAPFIDCQSQEAIEDEVVRATWNTPRIRVGATARADLFPRKLGFFPDPMTPRDLRRSDSEVRLEASYGQGRWEFAGGIGYGAGRAKLDAALVSYYSPSLSLAYTVHSLTGDPLYKDGKLNIINGKLPPRLVVGLDAQLQYAPNPPAGQVVKIQQLQVTGYFDFRFTEKLTVRIGAPISAKLETREGDTSVGGKDKRDRQWTIPVFAATVLKL